MFKTAFLLALIVTAFATMPAHAQQRVFVSGHGLDTNPCTVTQPCRTFQQAHNAAAANGEIDVLDPAGYGPLTITKGISVQAHGFSGITQTTSCATCAAITISVTTSDPVSLNGLLLDGAGTGLLGIYITSGSSVQILNSVVRHFGYGIYDQTNASGSKLLIQDTIASDNSQYGIIVAPIGGGAQATLSRTSANNNGTGVDCATSCITWLAKTVISGNVTGLVVAGTVNSYGDNHINDPIIIANGILMPVTQ
jgi:hypothetical protein